MLKNVCIAALLLTTQISIAQNIDQEWVDKAKQSQKDYADEDNEPEIVALTSNEAYTFDMNEKQKTPFATKQLNETYIAVKALAKSSVSESRDNESSIDEYEVLTGSKLNKEDYMARKSCYSNFSESIFSSDLEVCVFPLTMNKLGERKAFELTKTFTDIKYLTSVYFREHFPIEEKTVTFKIPDWLEVEFIDMNFDGFNITKKQEEVMEKKKKYTLYTYTAKKLDKRYNERKSFGSSYYEPHITIVFKKFKNDDKEEILFSSTDDLYAWYRSLIEECNNNHNDLKSITAELTKDCKTDQEKVEAIYYWIQDNIRYIAFEDGIMGFKPDEAQNVYNKRYGDCKGMANLAKVMLENASIDARLTWIGTKRISPKYDYSFPSLANDNHMICTVMIDGKKIFIDPTESYIGFNDYAERIQGKMAMIEDGDNYILEKVPEFDKTRNKVMYKRTLTIDGDKVKGNTHAEYNGEEKTQLIYSYNNTETNKKAESLVEFLEDYNKNITVSNHKSSDLEERTKPLTFDYDFEIANHLIEVGDEKYLSLEFEKEFENSKIEEPRHTDIYLGMKINRSAETVLNIPEGYTVNYLPEKLEISGEGFSFNTSYEQQGNQVIYKKNLSVDKGVIKASKTKEWNEAIKKLGENYNDQIILKK